MTSPDNTATNWRDLADQLTPWQAARLESVEFMELPASPAEREPVGAGYLWHWEQDDSGQWVREFVGTGRKAGGFDVSISGRQYPDGSVFRTIAVQGDDREEFDVAGARQFAAELLAAADEIEGLR